MDPSLGILFTPFDLAGLRLRNRFVMPAMTRSRCPEGGVPDALTVTYYSQRAGAGLVIGEGTNPMPGGTSFPGVPEIYRPEHVAGWKKVAEAVHARGSRMFLQLWHSGRCSHRDWQPDGRLQGGPSAIRAAGGVLMTPDWKLQEPETPRAFELSEIQGLIDGFVHAARCAIEAGMDGVEIHGANGYLVHQFISERSNQRTDRYGGSPENRIRFPLEVAEAIAGAIGPERTAIRISPTATHQDGLVGDPDQVYPPLLAGLSRLGLAYVHCIEGQPGGQSVLDPGKAEFDFKAARRLFDGAWIANNFYDPDKAARAIAAGDADLVSFGRFFVANPDYPERVRRQAPLNEMMTQGLYAGRGAVGYTDHPALEPEPA